jgi:hypothetical protein
MALLDGFQPQYILESELPTFGLPTVAQQANIINLVQAASTLIDEHCGRVEDDGGGSLVYSTYTERVEMPEGRNVVRLSYKPLVAIAQATVAALQASGGNFYTGVQANAVVSNFGSPNLSPIISCSGRYGYGRRDNQMKYPDSGYMMNLLQVASYFGGPPQFTAIDPTMIDYDPRTGEIWVPAGLYISNYTELQITYNTGFDPRNMPRAIKHATAAVIKNALAKGAGTTGIKSITGAGRVNVMLDPELIDPNIEKMLANYVNSMAM